jgi:hypothetical protein
VGAHAAAADQQQRLVAVVALCQPLEEARVGLLLAVASPLDQLVPATWPTCSYSARVRTSTMVAAPAAASWCASSGVTAPA